MMDDPRQQISADHSSGATIVRAWLFGQWRRMRLLARQGYHVHAESCDDGPWTQYLLTEADVHTDDQHMLTGFGKVEDCDA